MYDLIYEFLYWNLFYSEPLENVTFEWSEGVYFDLSQWLAHSCTMVTMCLIFAFFVFAVIWVFKFVGGLFGGIGR